MKQKLPFLLAEAQFTNDIICTGITHLGKVNYAKKGYYYTAFSAIGTGLERIGKLCYLVDYFLEYDEYPNTSILKNEIGHDILKLYEYTKNIISKNNLELEFKKDLDDDIYVQILSILSKFAKGDRYSNIDYLTNSKYQSTPVADWFNQIEKYIFINLVSKNQSEKIAEKATIFEDIMRGSSTVFYVDENNDIISSLGQASFRTGMAKINSKYRILYVSQIVRYFVEILTELQYIAVNRSLHEIPFFSEVFTIFLNSDKYLKSRKNFERIR